MLRVAHASRPLLAAPRRARARRATVAAVQRRATDVRRSSEPPLHRLALRLTTLAAPVVRASTPQKVLVTSLGASAALLLLRWRAVLGAITPPALAVAAVGWVLAHENRAALEEDVLLLIHPERPRAAANKKKKPQASYDENGNDDFSGVVEIDDDDEELNEPEPPEEGPWDGGFTVQRASVLDAERPDLLSGIGGDGPKTWRRGTPPPK